jgi:hypothetical protein
LELRSARFFDLCFFHGVAQFLDRFHSGASVLIASVVASVVLDLG